jgi:predicted Rossmann fold flavoprotein
MKTDVAVIGGGAAGLMAAGTAASRGLSTILLEPNDRLGCKLRITGKGRCNLTNNCGVKEFLANVPTNPKFLYSCLTAFSPADAMGFFESIGLALKTERGNRVFPVSDSANEAADRLANWVKAQGVLIVKARAVAVERENGSVSAVRTDKGRISCRAVIVCTGGLSYSATGSTGDGYDFAANLGHTVTLQCPSLVPLECAESFCSELAGFSPRNVTLTAFEDGRPVYRELGEMLFTHFGVSGPLVLSASAHMRRFEICKYTLAIDFKPALDEEKLDARILRDFSKFANRDFANALSALEAYSFIPVLVRCTGIAPETKVHDITRVQRRGLVALLKAFPLTVIGPRPVEEAVVTAGGVDVRQVDPRTMQSKLVPGLYFAGEILDTDAYTGGFNLQIAWATGRCAGSHVLME